MIEYQNWDEESHREWKAMGTKDYWEKLYFIGTDPIHPDTIDIPCEVVDDKRLPERTETPKP